MTLISAHKIACSYGPDDIFDQVSVGVPPDARIAIVGPNGTGKTSLVRILIKEEEPTDGQVFHARGLRIGYLPQRADAYLKSSGTMWDEMLTVFEDVLKQEAALNQLADQLAEEPDNPDLLDAYGEAQTTFDLMGGYEYVTHIKQVLTGVGFNEKDYDAPLGQLSGGQKTRVLLARLLLQSPDVLVLDEPTNHLDIQAIEWLENWLKGYDGALVVVSHDRYFMDSVVSNVWELIFGQMEEYRGNYSAYLRQREERHAALLKAYEKQQEFIAKEEEYIRRNIEGQNTRQAQGRRKRLERFLRDEAIFRPRQQQHMRLSIDARRRSGDEVLRTKRLVIGYHDDQVPLFEVPDITLKRGECAALIGPNGAGKSTFMKTILGELDPLSGETRIGANVEIGYFAQAHERLNSDNTIFDEILTVKDMLDSEARTYLGSFLFSGDDVYKPISALSGGERGRVALAKLALSGANLLLLDEPTNHLDIQSQEILEVVLSEFRGTVLLISHDRYLVERLATQIWAIQSQTNGRPELMVVEGTYDDYLRRRAQRQEAATLAAPQPNGSQTAKLGAKSNNGHPSGLSLYQREKRIAQLEEEIHALEGELAQISNDLEEASAQGNVAEVTRLGEAYSHTEQSLESLIADWEYLHD
ncbi:MAG: ABC-F family ATP-binding cassette domain-containing protein [Chloroflexi bacterium]|nr:ABC-F family ATP-binding cassette domain-containing protein [Chloroflexota bacterium]